MKVKEIMKQPVITVGREATIRECGDLLEKNDVNGVPVMDGNRVVGVITRTDIFRSILPRYPEIYEEERYLMDFDFMEERIGKINKIKVEELMGSPAITIAQDTPLCKAGSLMVLRKIKQVPVVSDDKLVGIVTLTDICRHLMRRAAVT